MKPETVKKLKSAALRAALFTFIMLLMKALFAYSDNELKTIFQPKFYIFGLILFLVMFPLYYFTTGQNPTWGGISRTFKRKKQ